jgi:hypothetical protein
VLFHERLKTHDDFFDLGFGLVELVFVEEKYFPLPFLLFKLFVDFLLKTIRLLAHSFLGCVKLEVGRSLGLLKGLLGLVLIVGIDLDYFSWMSTDHVRQVVVSILAEIIFLFIGVQVLEVEVLELGEVFNIKFEGYFSPLFSVGDSLN